MFQALCKRRNVAIRYDRYAHALTTAAVYNVNRTSADDPVVMAFDFVRDAKSSAKRERLREVKHYIRTRIGGLPMGTPRAMFLNTRRKIIADLLPKHSDAEELFDECWPSLKPTKDEVTP